MAGEEGVKNSLDPSLGSQALFVAPELRAVIWMQYCLTLKVDGDQDSEISCTFASPFHTKPHFFFLSRFGFTHLPALYVGLQLFQSLQFLHLPLGLIDVGADGLHGLQSLLYCWVVGVLLWGPLQQFLSGEIGVLVPKTCSQKHHWLRLEWVFEISE